LAEAWLALGRIHAAQQEWQAAVDAYSRLAELGELTPPCAPSSAMRYANPATWRGRSCSTTWR